MKTIFIVYSATPLADAVLRKTTKFCFNTDSDIAVGDKLVSPAYNTPMFVTDVLESSFNYYNRTTGALSNEIKSTLDYPIKTLVLRDDDISVVYATKELVK